MVYRPDEEERQEAAKLLTELEPCDPHINSTTMLYDGSLINIHKLFFMNEVGTQRVLDFLRARRKDFP